MSHIPTGGGLVNPANEIGAIANEYGVPYLLDACQSIGQMSVDVADIGCDFLSATGRKFLRGPRGTGFLYVKQDWIERLEPPLIDQFAADLLDEKTYLLREMPGNLKTGSDICRPSRIWKSNRICHGFGLPKIQQRIFKMADKLREGLQEIPQLEVTDQGRLKCGIVTFRHEAMDAATIKSELARRKINVSVSSGSGSRLSFMERGIESVVRASMPTTTLKKSWNTFYQKSGNLLHSHCV